MWTSQFVATTRDCLYKLKIQVSHTFHISAVAPSTYRFHVEHLQSDTDSKDTVSFRLLLSASSLDKTNRVDVHKMWFLLTGLAHAHWRNGFLWQPERTLFIPPERENTSQSSVSGCVLTQYKCDISGLICQSNLIKHFCVFQTVQSQFVTWQFESEYRGSDFTAAVTMANPDIFRESGASCPVRILSHFCINRN